MRYILTDVEGTTTAIRFVHETLFSYALARLDPFLRIRRGEPEIAAILADVARTVRAESGQDVGLDGCVEALKSWTHSDRKHPALKSLQGLIWKEGFESGEIVAHVYDDVPAAFRRWRERGLGLGIYSSGSVLAQKLLFGHTRFGDLNGLIQNNFDASVGAKRDDASYGEISARLKIQPSDILFLSDVAEELAAAQSAGLAVIQLVREGGSAATRFESAPSFELIVR